MAYGLILIENAYIKVEVDPGYFWYQPNSEENIDKINKTTVQEAEILLDKLNNLNCINTKNGNIAYIVYDKILICSFCKGQFGIDNETLLSSCCNEKVTDK